MDNTAGISRRDFVKYALFGSIAGASLPALGQPDDSAQPKRSRPNIVLIYADDIGFGDLGCYGAEGVSTPHVDRLARQGLQFMNAYATSATCTPSRYSLLTGRYAWRKRGTGVLAGDAGLIIDTDKLTLPSMLKSAGYTTGVVGKWHLGLGAGRDKTDWNGAIAPGPLEIGFDYSFLIPATGDRVPCVFVENHHVVNLDPDDPIRVDYRNPIADSEYPDGRKNRDQLTMDWSHGHNQTVINGIGRIGYMAGGTSALWEDQDIADTLTGKAIQFLQQHRDGPFFLYFSTHDIHVPRVPHPRFEGKSTMGPRGDAIFQFDWCVGQIMAALERLGAADNTLVILSSDNGPVLDDGYRDRAVEKVGGHRPAGPLRGGKYSNFEAGTRVPLVVCWDNHVKAGLSTALLSQVDLIASLAALTGQDLDTDDAPDSLNSLDALLGKDASGREYIIEHAGALSIRVGDWKYIEPSSGPKIAWATGIEMGNLDKPQLYRISDDPGERRNVAEEHPAIVERLAAKLDAIKAGGRSRT